MASVVASKVRYVKVDAYTSATVSLATRLHTNAVNSMATLEGIEIERCHLPATSG